LARSGGEKKRQMGLCPEKEGQEEKNLNWEGEKKRIARLRKDNRLNGEIPPQVAEGKPEIRGREKEVAAAIQTSKKENNRVVIWGPGKERFKTGDLAKGSPKARWERTEVPGRGEERLRT